MSTNFSTMILYNITFNIEPDIKDDWHSWMKAEYLPYVEKTNLFNDVKLYKLLNETESQGITYSVQFFSDSLKKVNIYLENYANEIVHKHNQTFKYKHVSFMTILESADW